MVEVEKMYIDWSQGFQEEKQQFHGMVEGTKYISFGEKENRNWQFSNVWKAVRKGRKISFSTATEDWTHDNGFNFSTADLI